MIDWKRVLRTVIQAGCGAGIAFVNSLENGFTVENLTTSALAFVTTVLVAFLMNIKKQTEDDDNGSKTE